MVQSRLTAAKQLRGLFTSGWDSAPRESSAGASASVRYGVVQSIAGESVTVLLDGSAEAVTLKDATASARLKAGDRVKIVKQGQGWVIDLAGGISRALDTAVSEASARMDAHDKKMAEQQKEIKAAQDELAGMDGKISDAVDKAISQLETPDGGNHIYAGETEPAPPKDGFKAGDLWYQTNSGSQITAVKVWNGTVWNDYDMVANSILVAGSVGSTLIADGAITTAKITAKAVTADQIAANTITGAEIRADSVDVNEIASGDIYCKRLTATDGAGYTEMTGNKLEMLDSGSRSLIAIWVEGGVCYINANLAEKISIGTNSGSVLNISNGGFIFSSMMPGFRVNGVSAVESFAIAPGSATESFSANVPYSPRKTSYAVVYYRCTYTDTAGSVKFPITEGGSANVVLKELTAFEAADESIALGCAENITVALGNSPNKTFAITRGNPYRFAIKPSGNSVNANPGSQFEITQVTLCGE